MNTKRSLALGLGPFLLLLLLGGCNQVDGVAPGAELSTLSVCEAGTEVALRDLIANSDCSTITITDEIELEGTLELGRALTIEGRPAPAARFALWRDLENPDRFRIVRVARDVHVTLRNLIVRGGSAVESGCTEEGCVDSGGGILNQGTLMLDDVVVSRNAADIGGGIANLGDLTIEDSTIESNYADAMGGGIDSTGGTLAIRRTTIAGNRAQVIAGGLMVEDGAATITDSTISGNWASMAGGLGNQHSNVTLERSTVSGNAAAELGGGIASVNDPDKGQRTTILNSTVSGNCVGVGCPCVGMGCLIFGEVEPSNGTALGIGGGIYTWYGQVRIDHSTVTDNHADGAGGGVYSNAVVSEWDPLGARTEVKGSILWGNTSGTDTPDDLAAANAIDNGYLSGGYNLIGAAGVNVNLEDAFGRTGDQRGVDPMLEELLPNAPGTTATHALRAGSPALDKGTCTDHDGATVPTDQRGVTRPQGSACDVGAFEREAATTYHGTGFYEPVGVLNSIFLPNGTPPTPEPATIWNTARGNSTIPFKFSLYAYDGGPEITDPSGIAFSQTTVTCPSSSAGDDAVDFTTTGSTSLRYDTTEGLFIQNWKAPKVSRDTCYLVSVTFPDDTALYAFMRLRK